MNTAKIAEKVLNSDWTCPGIAGRRSALSGPQGQRFLIGAKPCGVRIPYRYFNEKTRDVSGRRLCLACADEVEGRANTETVDSTARAMNTTPEEVRGMRQWQEEVRKSHEDNPDVVVDMMDSDGMKDAMEGRKLYPVSGEAVCTNPHDQNTPLQTKIAENLKKTPPEQHSLGKIYKNPVV
jgi:hypothetical protein